MSATERPSRSADWVHEHQVGPGDAVAVVVHPVGGAAIATPLATTTVPPDGLAQQLRSVEEVVGPRWVWWDRSTAAWFVAHDVRVDRCWDVVTVHRLLVGGSRASIPSAWAHLAGLPLDGLPSTGQLDLFAEPVDEGDPDVPVRPDGYLRPEWPDGAWAATPDRMMRWAALALTAADRQRHRVDAGSDRMRSTANAESMTELLCVELEHDGLPFDRTIAEALITAAVGGRPRDDARADELARRRDEVVLAAAGDAGYGIDLRNPAGVRSLLRRVGVDVPDTRAWRLERLVDAHPVVPALLAWRKAERIATTYGFRWVDEHVDDGRLRGRWASSDGAAGRMTATAGLHNLPADLRPAVAADADHRLVRADLGQIEPRVLAAVSGDPALVAATREPDLYRPVADRLGVAREVAKVAVLGAMYGATTGESAPVLRALERAYPRAMAFLADAAAAGERGETVTTVGGRPVPMWVDDDEHGDLDRARRVAAARGRFARNATIQGAAAELFKAWALIVRLRVRPLGGRVVLCLHDELLVHVPTAHADAAADRVRAALGEAAHHWSPHADVRFVADVTVVERWSDVGH